MEADVHLRNGNLPASRRSIWHVANDILFGYDFFISYAHSDGAIYARALSRALSDCGFECFIDHEGLVGGDNWRWIARRALKKTSRLILIASPCALVSEAVLHEVQTYHVRGLDILPIDFDGTLPLNKDASGLLAYITPDIIRIPEQRERLATEPSYSTIEQITRSFTVRRQSQRRAQWMAVAATTFFVLSVLAALFGFLAEKNRRVAFEQGLAAEERAREAEVSRQRALASQSFAESERAHARSLLPEDANEAESLRAVVPKYRSQSHRYLEQATKLQADLDTWRRDHRREPAVTPRVFAAEALQAGIGTSLLLHYGDKSGSRLVLVDGGPRATYEKVLKPRLESLRAAQKDALRLELVVSSQSDEERLGGLVELFRDLARQKQAGTALPIRVETVWSSVSVPESLASLPALASWQKSALPALAHQLAVPLNHPFSRRVRLSPAGVPRVRLADGLSVTVLGPPANWVERLDRFWLDDFRRRKAGGEVGSEVFAALWEHLRKTEDFTNDKIDLVPSPIEIRDFPIPADRDNSTVNLASLALLFEFEGMSILLPSDTRGDILLAALAQAGLTDSNGEVWVDMLELPHAGSASNVSAEFFRRVRAHTYLISTSGKIFRRPDVKTLQLLFDARRNDRIPFDIAWTHPIDAFPHASELKGVISAETQLGTRFKMIQPEAGSAAIRIDLKPVKRTPSM